ncbi:LAFE_0A03598g1_1 [Lachancea fermentati]|uniref:LAFE_0A03598g1_1 n=1 Tax=Lachancea fermentati TaxID=4955 RepID=A0A1G4M6J7_LACFM|nr:LAFE_0A03598g1_1 [Lachancea fermentati]
MGRKSKSNRRQRKKDTNQEDPVSKLKQELVTFLDETRQEKKTNGLNNNDLDKIGKPTVLSEQYSTVFARFQNQESSQDNSKSIPPKLKRHEEGENIIKVTTDAETSTNLSKKKLRKINKPSLSQLKSLVSYPQVIQWYDCDAKDPELLADIKSQKNVVPVPSHWQLKREYLSGRSVLAKKPFELPDIIQQTNIEEMRNTLPTPQQAEENSLKDTARARIQPKLGSLDIDFKKLHDAFFKLGSKWKPDIMLAFGDIYYENRNLDDEARWRKMELEMRPGRISDKLRLALNLPEGKIPPWCSKMKELGMPPAYPNYKIAGVNWDITNLQGNVYGSIGHSKHSKKAGTLFGQILTFEDEEDTFSDVDNHRDSHEEAKTFNNSESGEKTNPIPAKGIEEVESISIAAVESGPSINNPGDQSHSPRQLYTVLSEKEKVQNNGITTGGVVYEIPGSKRNSNESEVPTGHKKQRIEQKKDNTEAYEVEEIKGFKF